MGTNQTSPPWLEKMSRDLLKDIKAIKSEEKAQISDKIMERLRGDTIFLPKTYVDKKETAPHCTIDPKECLDLTLSQIETGIGEHSGKIDLVKQGIVAIKGNSLGPYLPKLYFQDDMLKIVCILKEPYIFKGSYKNGDRGGHNQAAEYIKYYNEYGSFGNPTHNVILEISQLILQKLATIPIEEIELISNPVIRKQIVHLQGEDLDNSISIMSHVCIIEVNHFPGLAFNKEISKTNSNDNDVLQWESINSKNIAYLIDLFESLIFIGPYENLSMLSTGDPMAKVHLFNFLKSKSYFELKAPNGYPDAKMLSEEIVGSENIKLKYKTKEHKQKEKLLSMVLDTAGRRWFACPHPSAGCWKSVEFKHKLSKWITEKVIQKIG